MKSSELFTEYEGEDFEVTSVCHNTAAVTDGSLFFCLKGSRCDGHDHASIAIERGASAVVCERDLPLNCRKIKVKNTRAAFAYAAAAFYGFPSRKLRTFGITGTNGKTTTSYVLAEILKEAGAKVGLIGTNCIRYAGVEIPASLTTPDPVDLNRTLSDMVAAGVTDLVMEVSAHALALDKTCGTVFDVAGFTNLSRDHLDFFGDMETYAQAKRKLFSERFSRRAAINTDDDTGREIFHSCQSEKLSYGTENCNVKGCDLSMSADGITYTVDFLGERGLVRFALPGKFNMYNTLCAASMAKLAGVDNDTILRGIGNLKRVEGRYNVIKANDFSVIIDFAHTDDGLGNIITSVREFAPARIITVFGCGGNRDTSKRAAMGRIASTLSDLTVITSDNPRYEDPQAIVSQIYSGVPESAVSKVYTEPDREEAIKFALDSARSGDIVIVAGKGAEQYQEICGVKHRYNDEDFIMKLLRNGGNDR